MTDKSSSSTTAHQTTGLVSVRQSASAVDPSPMPSATLLRGRKTVAITHNGMLYMLQATKLGKLILTK